jgi:type I restriction enzyme M protein
VNHLKPNGRAGIIVPEGVIFQSGKAYRQLRKELVEGGLYAVVSLPSGVFSPYSGVKTSILLINNEVANKRDDILFVKIAADGYDLGAAKRQIDKNDLPQAKSLIDSWAISGVVDSDLAFAISKSQISKNAGYGLSGDRYIDRPDRTTAFFEYVKLEDVVEYEQPTKYLVATENYDSSYPTPVLTAGKSFVLGYTDEIDGIYDGPLPVIIFDDFTTASRLVNFRFKVKSSAMKFLHVDRSKALPAFVYYMMQHIDFPFTEHKRYWISEYSKFEIPLPPLEVQLQIVAELDGYAAIIDGAKKIVENWKPRIDVDSDWPMFRLGEICDVRDGTHDSPKFLEKGIPFITSKNLRKGQVDFSDAKFISKEDHEKFSKRSSVEDGDILLGLIGTIGNPVMVSKNRDFSIKNVGLIKNIQDGKVNNEYIRYLLDSPYADRNLYSQKQGATQKFISLGQLRGFVVPLPPIDVQIALVEGIRKELSSVEQAGSLMDVYAAKISEAISSLWRK